VANKTPSPRVIAAQAILNKLNEVEDLTPQAFGDLLNCRVSQDKAEKVVAAADKITKSLVARCQKIVDRFNTPPAKDGAKPTFGKK
jgi:hypothetical protein